MKTKNERKRKFSLLTIIAVIIVSFAAGYVMRGCGQETAPAGTAGMQHDHADSSEIDEKVEVWTCSMHPQIRQPEPGDCPICGMDLIPAEVTDTQKASASGGDLKLSERARKLAEIRTARVERRYVSRDVKLFGKVTYDETRIADITAWVDGRLDRLYADYTGIPVKKNDHMVYMYSPSLYTAQQELIQAAEAASDPRNKNFASLQTTAAGLLDAAREKLKLLGLTEGQISKVEERGTPSAHMTIYAPRGGIVTEKHAVEGMYVKTGTRIYTIADLSQVWVMLDAYESDLPWLRYAQRVQFEAEAYPGEIFNGRISFIDPVMDTGTRTVKIRVNADNASGKLKPGMFVRAHIRAELTEDGDIMSPDLAGKWISHMHPEIIKDGPGKCDICGMPLVKAETLGFVSPESPDAEPPLTIPASAPLITGKRAVVYVALQGQEGVYEGREIVLGPRAGEYYIVKKGLEAGERVVTSGAFKIDSAVQITAGKGMMTLDGKTADAAMPSMGDHDADKHSHQMHDPESDQRPADLPEGFKESLNNLYESYFKLHKALSQDSPEAATNAFAEMKGIIGSVETEAWFRNVDKSWKNYIAELKENLESAGGAEDIEGMRTQFALTSEILIAMSKRFAPEGTDDVYRHHCPMAFDNRGAYWLQHGAETENPYFGAMMYRCADIVEKLSGGAFIEQE